MLTHTYVQSCTLNMYITRNFLKTNVAWTSGDGRSQGLPHLRLQCTVQKSENGLNDVAVQIERPLGTFITPLTIQVNWGCQGLRLVHYGRKPGDVEQCFPELVPLLSVSIVRRLFADPAVISWCRDPFWPPGLFVDMGQKKPTLRENVAHVLQAGVRADVVC